MDSGLNLTRYPQYHGNPSGSCQPGGFYICTYENVFRWCGRGSLIADATLLEDSQTYQEPFALKCDSVKLSNIRPLSQFEGWKDLNFCIAAVSTFIDLIRFVDSSIRDKVFEGVKLYDTTRWNDYSNIVNFVDPFAIDENGATTYSENYFSNSKSLTPRQAAKLKEWIVYVFTNNKYRKNMLIQNAALLCDEIVSALSDDVLSSDVCDHLYNNGSDVAKDKLFKFQRSFIYIPNVVTN